MIENILARWFPPKLGRVDRAVITRHLLEIGALTVVDLGPAESLAFNVQEWPNGRWAKGVPVQKVSPTRRRRNWTLIETF